MATDVRPIPGVVLAAGESARFGDQNKLLLNIGDAPVIVHALKAILESNADPITLITGYQADPIAEALDDLKSHSKLSIVNNPDWAAGRASSLKMALENVPGDVPGVLIHLADMPLVPTALINRLISIFLEHRRLTFPVFNNKKGNPIIWPRDDWPKLMEIHGDKTAFELIKSRWDEATKLELGPDEEPSQWDLDTPENYQLMLKYWDKRS